MKRGLENVPAALLLAETSGENIGVSIPIGQTPTMRTPCVTRVGARDPTNPTRPYFVST